MQRAVSIYIAPSNRSAEGLSDIPVELETSDEQPPLVDSDPETEALPVPFLVATGAESVADLEGDTAVLMTKRYGKVSSIFLFF
jgi:hypothetical protein